MNPFQRLFRSRPVPPGENLRRTVQMIRSTEEGEIDCEAAFDLVHQYAELVSRGEDPRRLLPEVHRHLAMCPDCREELEALLRAMGA